MTRAAVILGVVGGMAALSAQGVPAAQPAPPAFEVTSIKRGAPGVFPDGPEARPGGVFLATTATPESVIRFAYGLPSYQVAGGPAWTRTERFDFEARAGREVPVEELRRMVQALLADRFQLVVHREPREMSVYTLLRVRTDGRLGPNLRQSPADCPGQFGTMEERRTPNGGVTNQRTCAPLQGLISTLSSALQSPVDDRTGLTGRWDSELSFTGERRRGADPSVAARDPNDAPALFTAVQEQLGLKLEPARGPVDVLVIDSVAMPTPD